MQSGRRGFAVRGELRRLLVASLGLAERPAGEAQVGQHDRQPMRLRAVLSSVSRPAQRTPQLIGDLIERRPPATDIFAGVCFKRGSGVQAPAQVTRRRRDGLANIIQSIEAVLPDRFQGAVASSGRVRDRDDQALVGKPGQDDRDSFAGHRQPTSNHGRRRRSKRRSEHRDPAQDRPVRFLQQRIAPVEQ
jgi:hypothetical protein